MKYQKPSPPPHFVWHPLSQFLGEGESTLQKPSPPPFGHPLSQFLGEGDGQAEYTALCEVRTSPHPRLTCVRHPLSQFPGEGDGQAEHTALCAVPHPSPVKRERGGRRQPDGVRATIINNPFIIYLSLVLALCLSGIPTIAMAQSPTSKPVKAAKTAKPAKTARSPKAARSAPVAPKAASAVTAEAPRQRFARANQLYSEGSYGEAAALFRALVLLPGWQQFAVYYNLGNCYFRLQHYGKALAYYRKAQRLRPNHASLIHNIALLYKRAGKDSQDAAQIRMKSLFWYYLLNLKQLFFVVIVLTYLLLLLWAITIRRKAKESETKGLLRWSLAGLAAVAVVLWISLGIKAYHEQVRQVGVITTERISARSGYGKHFEPLFWLSEADEVVIKEQVNVKERDGTSTKWLRIEIQLTDKKQKQGTQQLGWVPSSAVQAI